MSFIEFQFQFLKFWSTLEYWRPSTHIEQIAGNPPRYATNFLQVSLSIQLFCSSSIRPPPCMWMNQSVETAEHLPSLTVGRSYSQRGVVRSFHVRGTGVTWGLQFRCGWWRNSKLQEWVLGMMTGWQVVSKAAASWNTVERDIKPNKKQMHNFFLNTAVNFAIRNLSCWNLAPRSNAVL